MKNKNTFYWLKNDIESSLILKVYLNNDKLLGIFEIVNVLETDGDDLNIKTANIDDLTNLISLGIVRFANIINKDDIIDIPFRKLYKLYINANILEEKQQGRKVSLEELDGFSVINQSIKENIMIYPIIYNTIPESLLKVIKVSFEFGNYGMQQKFDALSDINLLNHQRVNEDNKSILK